MRKSAFAKKMQAERLALQSADFQTERQYMADTMALTLNDPAVMGKNVFGRKRLKRVMKGWGEKYDAYREALTKLPEADYKRERLDGELRRIMGEDFQPFLERYDFMPEVRTGKGK